MINRWEASFREELISVGVLLNNTILIVSKLLSSKCALINPLEDHFIVLFESLGGKANNNLLNGVMSASITV